jgi:hypothetical protein
MRMIVWRDLRGLEIVTRTLELLFTFWCLLAYLASWALGHFASFMVRQLLALPCLEDVPLFSLLQRSLCSLTALGDHSSGLTGSSSSLVREASSTRLIPRDMGNQNAFENKHKVNVNVVLININVCHVD